MPINYPNGANSGIDIFNEPSLPEVTPLSQSGTATRNHVEHHHDLGAAIVALERNAAFKSHDHSGDGTTAHGNKLLWSNVHEKLFPGTPLTLNAARNLADTDYAATSLHHTLAARDAADAGELLSAGNFQAAVANHTHDFNGPSIMNQPMRICTSNTRPVNPPLGTMIYERDSNVVRVWARVDQSRGPVDQFFIEGRGGLAPPDSAFTPQWQILPVAKVPIFRAEATEVQEIVRVANNDPGPVARFQRVLQDFAWGAFGTARFQVHDVGTGIITIPENGLYEIRAEIHWDANRTFHEFSFMQMMVDNRELTSMVAQYTRAPVNPWGATSFPGQPQTNRMHFTTRLFAGEELTLRVKHDANKSSFLWHNNITPNKQAATIEIIFRAP